jgi:hypothetical protein
MRTILIVLLCINLQNCKNQKTLPENIMAYELVEKITGDEARAMVNQLHLQPVTNSTNEIGVYEREDKKATVYITHYKSAELAEIDLDKMVKKISPKNSVFINGGDINIKGVKAFRYFGMGQTHYVFNFQNMLIWLSIDTMRAEDFLKEYINYLE